MWKQLKAQPKLKVVCEEQRELMLEDIRKLKPQMKKENKKKENLG